MIKEAETFLRMKHEEFRAFRRALSDESDRGCALFAAAYLDKALSDLLFLSLVTDKRIEQDLFRGNAPLTSFSSRIKLAYYLGKISNECRADLDAIRGIRNEFAHHATIVSFEDQSIADRCRNLQFSYHKREYRPRGHFSASASRILGILQGTGLQAMAPKAKEDDRPSEEEKEKARQANEVAAKLLDKNSAGGESDA